MASYIMQTRFLQQNILKAEKLIPLTKSTKVELAAPGNFSSVPKSSNPSTESISSEYSKLNIIDRISLFPDSEVPVAKTT